MYFGQKYMYNREYYPVDWMFFCESLKWFSCSLAGWGKGQSGRVIKPSQAISRSESKQILKNE